MTRSARFMTSTVLPVLTEWGRAAVLRETAMHSTTSAIYLATAQADSATFSRISLAEEWAAVLAAIHGEAEVKQEKVPASAMILNLISRMQFMAARQIYVFHTMRHVPYATERVGRQVQVERHVPRARV